MFALLDYDAILAIHEEQLATHGGGIGLRDPGLLRSALARPENKIAYETSADYAAVAASYAFGLARNHPFIDGNQRTAYVAMILFLKLNDVAFVAAKDKAVIAMLRLASGETSEDEFADWIRDNTTPAHAESARRGNKSAGGGL